jgi:threonine dehydratase
LDDPTRDDAPLFSVADIESARRRLGERVVETPVHRWRSDELGHLAEAGTEVWLKLEIFQHSGTFKVRGAFNVLLNQPANALAEGITAISAGNHAIAVAYTARELGLSAKVIMLRHANPFRVQLCRALGAELLFADDAEQGFAQVERLVQDEGRFFVHPFEGLHTSLGTATLGLEFYRQVPGLEAVIVPIGGGGLASGVAAAVKLLNPACKVYGVEPAGAPTMTHSLAAGEPSRISDMCTVADSLAAPFTGPTSFALCRRFLDDVCLLSEQELLNAQAVAFRDLSLALEPAAAAATAGLLGPLRDRIQGLRVGVVMCGSNIDAGTFMQQLQHGCESTAS